MQRRAFFGLLGRAGMLAGVAVGGGAGEAGLAALDRRHHDEDGKYAAGPQGTQAVVWSVPRADKVIALTFDDGPLPGFTDDVLAMLADARVPATFFMIGRLAVAHPGLAAEVAAAGHELASHSWSHVSAATVDDHRNVDEVDRAADAIASVAGVAPRWYRPPRGMLVGAAVRRAHERAQGVAMWSVHRGDDLGDTDAAGVRDHLLANVHPGAVLDLHDGVGASGLHGPGEYDHRLVRRRRTELAVLAEVLAGWRAAGYRLVTLSQLAGGDGGGGDGGGADGGAPLSS